MPPSCKRRCINHPDNFCYICGEYTPPTHHAKLSSRMKLVYAHFLDAKWVMKTRNGRHIFVAIVAEQVFCFGLMEKGSKCHLVFQ